MKQQVGGLTEQRRIALIAARQRDFDAFFADLLRKPLRPLCEQARCITAFRALGDASRENVFEHAEKRERLGARSGSIAEARARTEMAGGASRSRQH
jgi:hypothetical protein